MKDASESVSRMKRAWENFARDDPVFYIRVDGKSWSREEFFASGAEEARRALEWLGEDVGRSRMLDLGCGLGRTAVHFAQEFERVDAVDISEPMISMARELNPPANVHYAVTSGTDLASFDDGVFDCVHSIIVFQHIADEAVLETYLSEIRRVLSSEGRALLHFYTGPLSPVRRLVRAFPDRLLPPTRRRFIRRYPRSPERLRKMMSDAGLRALEEHDLAEWGRFFLLARHSRHARPTTR